MEPDIYALSKAGFSKARIEEIIRCDDKEIQIRIFAGNAGINYWMKYMKAKSPFDEIDYIICKMKEQK